MKKHIIILLSWTFLSLIFSQNADLVTQKITLENAMQDKVNTTISKFLDPSQYIIVVNARLDFKPLSLNSSSNSGNVKNSTSSSYTFIPGLDMPSIPTDQTIYKPSTSGLSNFKYSSSLLYGLEIIIYLDENVATGSMQQNLKTLVQNNIPEIVDCTDCIKFETLDILGSGAMAQTTISDRIAELEQERRDAEAQLQNWRFEQLQEQLTIAQDARSEWEEQARNRERLRRIDDSTRMSDLQKIEKIYRGKQDSLYVLTSIKLDEAIRGRIASEENTKQELLDLIKLQIQGESTDGHGLSANTEAELYGKRPASPRNTLGAQTWLMVLLVLILLSILIILIFKNKKPVYLKPTQNNNAKDANNPEQKITIQPTNANSDDEVVKSELQSLRQSAVSMSVSEKEGANQIVKDWLEDKGSDENDNTEEEK